MNTVRILICGSLLLLACGGSSANRKHGAASNGDAEDSPDSSPSQEFKTKHSSTAGSAHGVGPSKIKATKTHAAMKFFVVDKRKSKAVPGMVVSLEGEDGKKYYTEETDSLGYGEVLVPVGQTYELVYLSLGETNIAAKVKVSGDPMQNIKLTLRFKRWMESPDRVIPVAGVGEKPAPETEPEPPANQVFRLEGVNFDSSSSVLLPESFERLDKIVEYLLFKKSTRIEISGHTDNTGVKRKNMKLSEKRAQACRTYLLSKGIAEDRIEANGYGDEKPAASNDTKEGRQKNRRIEVTEL